MNKLLSIGSLLLLLVPFEAVRADCDFDDFPQMEGMRLAGLAEAMQWNNMPMSVKGFQVESPTEMVRSFYEQRWQDEVDVTRMDAWLQILHINDECLMMVQVQALGGGSAGRLMLVNPPDEDLVARPLGAGVPMPPEAVVVTDMQSQDRFRDGQLVMLLYPDELTSASRWYEAEMVRSGWQLNRRHSSQNNATLIYSKGREQLSVVFLRTSDNQTQILLNRMDR
jgi:hypothetical protein